MIELDFIIQSENVYYALLFDEKGEVLAQAHVPGQDAYQSQRLRLSLLRGTIDAALQSLFQSPTARVLLESEQERVLLLALSGGRALVLIAGLEANLGMLLAQLQLWKNELEGRLEATA